MSFLDDGFLLADYRILKVLGSGGFGVTYLVRDEQLGKLFAIKEYFPSDFAFRSSATVRARERREDDFAWGKQRFSEEARVLASFDHPNIVKVVRAFDANNTSYMVQDYQSGRDLKQWVAELDSPPTQAELDQLIAPLLDALSVVHRNGVLHRDISPDNIYIRDDGTPVLLDFGSARHAVAQRTETISAMVKSGFSPAEQYSTKGKGQGPWSDIYAFAATIYSIVTRSAPEEATERLLGDAYVPAKQAAVGWGEYRESFLAAIDWGLKVPPTQRPQTVEKWRPALLGDAGVETTPNITSPGLTPDEADLHEHETTESQDRDPRRVQRAPVTSSNPAGILLFVLAGAAVLLAGAFIANQQTAKTVPVEQQTKREEDTWNNILWSDLDGLKRFVRNFPDGKYRSVAEEQIRKLENEAQAKKAADVQDAAAKIQADAELQAWRNTVYNDQDSLRAFVRNYPSSQYRSQAEKRIAELEREALNARIALPVAPIETVRAFYSALAGADGNLAASLVIPEKRANGPLSASAITKYYSSLSKPLLLVGLVALGDNRYQADYTYGSGTRTCLGSAVVTIVQRDNNTLVEGIKAPRDACS